MSAACLGGGGGLGPFLCCPQGPGVIPMVLQLLNTFKTLAQPVWQCWPVQTSDVPKDLRLVSSCLQCALWRPPALSPRGYCPALRKCPNSKEGNLSSARGIIWETKGMTVGDIVPGLWIHCVCG